MSSPTTPSSGSRLTTCQQISARSQYGPTTGTTSSSTNRRTVMKCDHCSSVNCSRTEKKSVPRDSPRCALVTCVIAGFLSGLALRCGGAGVEERLHDRSDAFGVCGQLGVAAVIDMQLASGYQPVHDPRVDQRDDRVVVTGQDQGGLPQHRQPRQAGPAEAGQQLVVIAPLRAAYPGSRWRRGVSIRTRTRGLPGTISAPAPVATSTRRRTRSGRLIANCCASAPPHEMPRTSAC